MQLQRLRITITDTQTNELTLQDEVTPFGSPILNYSGTDDKLQNIMASELSFDFEVPGSEDGKFLHLFTGSETRYKVSLLEVSDSLNPSPIWEGFLLAEVYSEPYKKGGFSVSFSATDGLGRIKSLELATDFYEGRKPISEVLAICLKATGLYLPIVIAPAIENAVAQIHYGQITVDTRSYVSNNKKEKAYSIIEKILNSIGCKLVQWNATWFILGYNQQQNRILSIQNFDKDGVFLGYDTLTRNNYVALFEGVPLVEIVPPYKSINIEWDHNIQKEIFPEDLVTQPESTSIMEINYWKYNGYTTQDLQNITSEPLNPQFKKYYLGGVIYRYWSSNLVLGEPGGGFISDYVGFDRKYLILDSIEESTGVLPYISFQDPKWIKVKPGTVLRLDFEMEIVVHLTKIIADDVKVRLENGDYDDVCIYELTLGDRVILSNKADFSEIDFGNFEFTVGDEVSGGSWASLKGVLKIKELRVFESGYLDLKIYPAMNKHFGVGQTPIPGNEGVLFKKLQLNLSEAPQNYSYNKQRLIDYSNVLDKEIFHSSDENDLTNRVFNFVPEVSLNGFQYQTNDIYVPVPFNDYYKSSHDAADGSGWNTSWYFYLDKKDYEFLSDNSDKLFYKKDGQYYQWTGVFQFFTGPLRLLMFETGLTEESSKIDIDASIHVKVPGALVSYPDNVPLRERWKRIGITEVDNCGSLISKIMHDNYAKPLQKIDGNLFDLIGPLDLLEFNYMNPSNYQITNLKLNLTNGTTNLSMIEVSTEIVLEYVTE